MNHRRILRRMIEGRADVRFSEFVAVVEGFGFELRRSKGSHRIYVHPIAGALISLQDRRGEAKPYQVRQFLKLVERYNLILGDDT